MTAIRKPRMTDEEYLAFERASPERHEFVDGEMYLMTGGSRTHSELGVRLVTSFQNRLRRSPCKVYSHDLRVQVRNQSRYFYPDLVIVCGGVQTREDALKDTVLNPGVIAEVLSPSTEAMDRGTKLRHYRLIDSLKTYLLVSQYEPLIERYERAGAFWAYTELRGMDAILELDSPAIEIPLSEIFEDVEFALDDRSEPDDSPRH
ncbi:MAG: Uma2 family endonuclease [Panacagrimonas sp.]